MPLRMGIWAALGYVCWYMFGGIATRMLIPKSLMRSSVVPALGDANLAGAAARDSKSKLGEASAMLDDDDDDDEDVVAGASARQQARAQQRGSAEEGFGDKGGNKYKLADSDDDDEL